MKKAIVLILFITLLPSCYKNQITKNLDEYLKVYGVNLGTCKVVSIVPAEGCKSCCMPSIEYTKKGNRDYLLVLTSNFQKSIDFVIQTNSYLKGSRMIIDSDNLAIEKQLVFITSPTIYFIKNGHVEKKIDLSESVDQKSAFKEVDKFLAF
jgi:hypothetical protein